MNSIKNPLKKSILLSIRAIEELPEEAKFIPISLDPEDKLYRENLIVTILPNLEMSLLAEELQRSRSTVSNKIINFIFQFII